MHDVRPCTSASVNCEDSNHPRFQPLMPQEATIHTCAGSRGFSILPYLHSPPIKHKKIMMHAGMRCFMQDACNQLCMHACTQVSDRQLGHVVTVDWVTSKAGVLVSDGPHPAAFPVRRLRPPGSASSAGQACDREGSEGGSQPDVEVPGEVC